MSTVSAPVARIESVAEIRLPPRSDRRLRLLMERNTEGLLTAEERDELESLVEWSESISLMRAQALHVLGRKPKRA